MNASRYLLILLGCVAITLPLELLLGARVYRRPRRLLATIVPVVATFGLWDIIAVQRGDWSFSTRLTLGLRILGLPLEEWLFFMVVPVCALLTYEAFGTRARIGTPAPRTTTVTVGRRDR